MAWRLKHNPLFLLEELNDGTAPPKYDQDSCCLPSRRRRRGKDIATLRKNSLRRNVVREMTARTALLQGKMRPSQIARGPRRILDAFLGYNAESKRRVAAAIARRRRPTAATARGASSARPRRPRAAPCGAPRAARSGGSNAALSRFAAARASGSSARWRSGRWRRPSSTRRAASSSRSPSPRATPGAACRPCSARASWGMSLTPKRFDWSIAWIEVYVAPPWSARPSHVTLCDWTWKNPPGFGGGYVLKVDKFSLHFDAASVLRALRDRRREAVAVSELHLTGVHFCAKRNVQDALNLMVSLDLQDEDENIISQRFFRREAGGGDDDAPPRPEGAPPPFRAPGRFKVERVGEPRSPRAAADAVEPDTPVRDPRRRPRWGVPLKLDVAHVFATDVRLDLVDFIQRQDGGALSGLFGDFNLPFLNMSDAERKNVVVPHIHVPRSAVVRGAPSRRKDGVYLGEVVWALIFALLNKVVWLAPQTLLKNGTMAALLAVKDVAALGVTKAAELTVNNLGRTGSGASAAVNPTARKRRTRYLPAPLETLLARLRVPGALDLRRGECVLEVTLHRGRRMTRCKRGPRGERADHLAVNAQAIVQLYKSDADDDHLRIVEQQASGLRLWTKAPSWGGETFLLGPVAAVETTTVRVVCIHRNLGGIAKKTPGKYATFGMRFGRRRAPPEGIVDDDLGGSLAKNRGSEPTSEIELSLSQLFLLGKAGPRNASKGLVGWFALTPPRRGPPPAELLTGDLKLGFKLRNPHLLENLSPGQRERIQKYPKRYIDVLNGSSRGMSPPPPKLRKSPKAAPRTPPRTPPVPVLAAPLPRKYCSTDCQRVDWRDRGHRKACKKIRKERTTEAARAEAPTPPPSPPVYGPAPRSGADEVRARIAAEHEAARARREAEPEQANAGRHGRECPVCFTEWDQ
ncbi:hypothetical protein JL721_6529 [Aureococcus anophagefferens]|nr:hypothetical protein JL721_6529 [Aureococcus anophagefferens]